MTSGTISISTRLRSELVDITDKVRGIVEQTKIKSGICHIFVPHTTGAITINENADPSVGRDIVKAMDRLIPWNAIFEHSEGNASAHIKSCLIGVDKSILVDGGRLRLGPWQGIFFCEFDGPRQREIIVKVTEG